MLSRISRSQLPPKLLFFNQVSSFHPPTASGFVNIGDRVTCARQPTRYSLNTPKTSSLVSGCSEPAQHRTQGNSAAWASSLAQALFYLVSDRIDRRPQQLTIVCISSNCGPAFAILVIRNAARLPVLRITQLTYPALHFALQHDHDDATDDVALLFAPATRSGHIVECRHHEFVTGTGWSFR